MSAAPDIGRADATVTARTTHQLYQRYGGQIHAYCLHQLRSREEAEDAVQTTFLNAFRGLQGGTVPHAEQAWLYKIAQNVCTERRSSSARRLRLETPNNFEVLQEVVPAPPRESAIELIGLEDALESMPENQRRAILLREWQGLSYREIGEELELSQASVEMLIFRARRTLAGALEQPAEQKKLKRKLGRSLNIGSALAALKSLLTGGAAVKAVAIAVAAGTVSVTASAVEHTIVRPHAHQKSPPALATPRTTEPVTASATSQPRSAAGGQTGGSLENGGQKTFVARGGTARPAIDEPLAGTAAIAVAPEQPAPASSGASVAPPAPSTPAEAPKQNSTAAVTPPASTDKKAGDGGNDAKAKTEPSASTAGSTDKKTGDSGNTNAKPSTQSSTESKGKTDPGATTPTSSDKKTSDGGIGNSNASKQSGSDAAAPTPKGKKPNDDPRSKGNSDTSVAPFAAASTPAPVPVTTTVTTTTTTAPTVTTSAPPSTSPPGDEGKGKDKKPRDNGNQPAPQSVVPAPVVTTTTQPATTSDDTSKKSKGRGNGK